MFRGTKLQMVRIIHWIVHGTNSTNSPWTVHINIKMMKKDFFLRRKTTFMEKMMKTSLFHRKMHVCDKLLYVQTLTIWLLTIQHCLLSTHRTSEVTTGNCFLAVIALICLICLQSITCVMVLSAINISTEITKKLSINIIINYGKRKDFTALYKA